MTVPRGLRTCRAARGGESAGEATGQGDRGSAVVEFVLVGALVTVLFAALLQLGLALHVRNVLVASASDGARYGANADRTPADAADRTRDLVATSLSEGFAADVTAGYSTEDGVPVVEVTVRAPFPVLGLIGPGGTLAVSGHALVEQ